MKVTDKIYITVMCVIDVCTYFACVCVCTCKEIIKNSIMSLARSYIFLTVLKKESKLFYSESNLAKDTLNYFPILIGRFCSQDTHCTLMLVSHVVLASTPMTKWKSCM